MFKSLATLFALALSVVALPADLEAREDSLPFEIVDGTVRWTGGSSTLALNVPRAVTAPSGFNMSVSLFDQMHMY